MVELPETPPDCPICGKEMQWSSNAEAYLCGPSGSGCEGTLSLEKAKSDQVSFGETR